LLERFGYVKRQRSQRKEKAKTVKELKNLEFDIEGTRQKLQDMADDSTLITRPVFRADSLKYPSNEMSFVDYHLFYIKQNGINNVDHYLSNLRMRIRIR